MTRTDLLKEAEAYREHMIADRRYLHQHPETGFDLTDTLAYVKQELTAMGYTPAECGKAGLTALAGGNKPGKVFLIRGDMDALPIREEAEVPFAAQNGKMHACGHDMHTAMLLGAARLLKDHEDEIVGTIKLDFQPAEEILEGAKDMINAGLLENPSVDAALMIHVTAAMPMTPGTAIVSDGGVSAPAADYFSIHIQGKGTHGSMPYMGIDPITVAAHMVTALQEIHARELALSEDAVLTIGTIHGGNAVNVIPDTATLGGALRSYDEKVHCFLKERLGQIATGIAGTFRASAEVTFGSGCPTLLNDRNLSEDTVSYLKELLGSSMALTIGQLAALSGGGGATKTTGSEDFAYVSHKVPSIMLALAAGQPDKGFGYPLHHPKVMLDESVLPIGSAIYAYTAMRWLEEHM